MKPGGFEPAEVGIKGRKWQIGADGEGGEEGVHPDLGRGGWDGSEFKPQRSRRWHQRSNPARRRSSSPLARSIMARDSSAVGGTNPGMFSERDTRKPVFGSIS